MFCVYVMKMSPTSPYDTFRKKFAFGIVLEGKELQSVKNRHEESRMKTEAAKGISHSFYVRNLQ